MTAVFNGITAFFHIYNTCQSTEVNVHDLSKNFDEENLLFYGWHQYL